MKNTYNHKVKIGIFDSGIGGIPVYSKLVNRLNTNGMNSHISVSYLGDTKNFPYGTKTTKQLKNIISGNIKLLKADGCDIIGIACNTASIIYNNFLDFDPNVIPVLNIAAHSAATISNSKVQVISSNYTAKTHTYKKYINRLNKNITVLESSEQLLIKSIEDDDKTTISKHINRIASSVDENTDVLVLGCTHFSYIKKALKTKLNSQGKNIKIVDPTTELTHSLLKKVNEFKSVRAGSAKYEISFSGQIPSNFIATQWK